MTKPTSKVMSPTAGTCLGTTPTYSVWLENRAIDTAIPAIIATGPAQLVWRRSKSMGSISASGWWRRRNWSQKTTASQGAIQ